MVCRMAQSKVGVGSTKRQPTIEVHKLDFLVLAKHELGTVKYCMTVVLTMYCVTAGQVMYSTVCTTSP
jgi:hypothetical protein